ncbi:MAG: hypothetical protein L3J03_01640 [Desulfobacterales bacterium]|nr:hypothetical protein [Desulfobacterales bacterium]
MPVSVYQWLRFVHSGLRSILVLFEQAGMGEDEVLVNAYHNSIIQGAILLATYFKIRPICKEWYAAAP